MAVVYITEFAGPAQIQGDQVSAAMLPPLASQTVAIGGSSVASNAFAAGTTLVRINTDAACSIAFGGAPTASATSMRLSAGATEYFLVIPNSALKVAVITNT